MRTLHAPDPSPAEVAVRARTRPPTPIPAVLAGLWSDRRAAIALVAATAAAAGAGSGWLMPRGPVLAWHVLAAVVGGAALGLGAGLVLGRRWSLLLTPVAFVLAFEAVRLPLVGGLTVDVVWPGSLLGAGALLLGRGVHGLLALLPMLAGARLGVAWAARLGHRDARPLPRVGVALLAALLAALLLLGVRLVVPASTAPILGADGQPLPGSIAELTTVELGGHEQAVMLRGRSTDDPVLLYLAGGPGGTDRGAMRADTGLEQHFVVATWDQRGTGASYAAIDPVETLTVDRMVTDTIELADHLRERFGQERILLVGNSWGTFLGALAAQRAPDRFAAVVGTGQMVSAVETDRMFYEDTLAWAHETGHTALEESLLEVGEPPYDDMAPYLLVAGSEHAWNPHPYIGVEMPFNLVGPELTWLDKLNAVRGLADTYGVLYPQLTEVDLRRDVPSLEVPYVLVDGAHESRGRAVLAEAWFDALDAPLKERIVIERAGHRPPFEDPAAFVDALLRVRAAVD